MKINKHISFILALLLLVSNVGLAFNVHYCGGELAGVSLDYKKYEPCVEEKVEEENACCATSNEHDSCCSNDKIDLKKSFSDEVIVKSFQLDLGAFTFTDTWKPIVFEAVEEVAVTSDTPSFYCDSNAPPLYKLYCQYIFYDKF
ncbi:HYC_CC_PP family protein [Flavobacterium pedocola]